MSATDTSLKPACLMMPSSSRALTAANCASPGDLLVYAMQLPKPYLLDAKLAAAPDRLLTQIFWTPSVSHTPGPGRLNPALVAIRMPS
jgi:hypothetical protein